MCVTENAYSEGFRAVSWNGLQQRYLTAVPWSASPCTTATRVLPTQLLFVLLLLASSNSDAAAPGWVGDLSPGAKRMTETLSTENTTHCLGAEMPALFHVELLAYPLTPAMPRRGLNPVVPALSLTQV